MKSKKFKCPQKVHHRLTTKFCANEIKWFYSRFYFLTFVDADTIKISLWSFTDVLENTTFFQLFIK